MGLNEAIPMTKVVLGIGTAGIAASLTWWALFYTKVLEVRGATMSREDWERGVSLFKDCMFWDQPQCVAVKATTNLTGYAPYEPLFLWLSAGVLLAGALLKIRDVWQNSP
jgi:hypothetical protein